MTTTPTRSRRVVALFGTVTAVVYVVDVLTKIVVVANLKQGVDHVRLLGGALYLQQARNSGAAFSLGTGFTIVLTVIAAAVVVVILRTAGKMRSTGWAVSLGLILGGALGNLTDRIFRAPGVFRGHVVDWISVFGPDGEHYPIFNAADSGIVCGAVLAAILAVRGIEIDGRRK